MTLFDATRPTHLRLTPKTALTPYDCTPHGIAERCSGHCCHSRTFWPPRTGQDGCPALGPTGCTLGDARPITCHLYPLRINTNATLVIHGATRFPHLCSGNRGAEGAPALIDAIQGGLIAIFGVTAWADARRDVHLGHDALLAVPPDFWDNLEHEAHLDATNQPPTTSPVPWPTRNKP